MRLGTFCLFVAVGFLATNSASAQNHDGLLTRLAARIQSHQHVHTHTHTVVAPPSAAAAAPTATAAGAYSTGADPYGFMRVFNRIRARAGLPPVAYDPNLSSWARRNNLVQCARGLGHHVNPGGVQNCAGITRTRIRRSKAGWTRPAIAATCWRRTSRGSASPSALGRTGRSTRS